jgi:hypothetical protein
VPVQRDFVASVVLLWQLAADSHPRRDEIRIAALAIIGRGMLVSLLAQLTMRQRGWSLIAVAAVLGWLAAVTAARARAMLRHGPRARLTTAALRHISGLERESVVIVAR